MKRHPHNLEIYFKLLLLVILSMPGNSYAQEEEKRTNFQKEFSDFKNSINQQFDSFVQHNDSMFVQFLQQSWKEFKGIENKMPVSPKPVQQPKVPNPSKIEIPEKKETTKLSPEIINPPFIPERKDSLPPRLESLSSISAFSSFEFYGTEISIPRPDNSLPMLKSITNDGIIHYFTSATNSSLLNTLIKTAKESSASCKLNDWGLASLLMAEAQKLYNSQNEQVLFTWYALIRNGYNAKVGFNNERVYLLLPATEKVYTTSYVVKGTSYYLFDFKLTTQQVNLLSIYEADYPGNKTGFSFQLTQIPQLGNLYITRPSGPDRPFELKICQNLMDFYNNYPTCELKVFFAAPLSESILKQLDLYFIPMLENKTDDEKVAFLLNFVQRGIPYQTDQEQFGREKYFFAEETLYYPAADCEDRAILLARLVNHYTKLEAIGLSYPEHVSLAVNITDIPGMKFFTYKDKHFYNCDPTYLGAGCGEIMINLIKTVPEIIDYKL